MTRHSGSYQPVTPICMAPWAFVENAQTMALLLDSILEAPQGTPSLFIDLEGEDLGRNGTICIMQIFDAAKGFTWLVDICTLGREAFDTKANCSQISLRDILECAIIPKVFYDVRNDSDALFAHFGIALQGIQDLQYMEVATRKEWEDKERLRSLTGCIQEHLDLNDQERKGIIDTKAMGRSLFSPREGGSYAVFKERPLRKEVIEYCVSDVKYMAALWCHYSQGMDEKMWRRVLTGSCQRVAESQSKDFSPSGYGKNLIVEGWGLQEGDDSYVSLSGSAASQIPVAPMTTTTTTPQPNAMEITVTVKPTYVASSGVASGSPAGPQTVVVTIPADNGEAVTITVTVTGAGARAETVTITAGGAGAETVPVTTGDNGSSSFKGAHSGAASSSLSGRQALENDDSTANAESWSWADSEGWGAEDRRSLAQDHERSDNGGDREAEASVVWSAFEGCSPEWFERVSLIVW